jgi:thimet oligopeptidase
MGGRAPAPTTIRTATRGTARDGALTEGIERPGPTLGRFPFSLPATELKARATATIDSATTRLDALVSATTVATAMSLLEPLDRILVDVYDLGSHGSLMFQVHPDAETRTAGREVSEAADRFFNSFRMNEAAFRALRGIDLAGEDAGTRFAVAKLLRGMRRAGVEHDSAGRTRVLALQNQIDQECNQYNENTAAGERSIEVEGIGELAGLPPDYLAAHPPGDGGRVRITTRGPDVRPVMAYCDSSDVRRRLLTEALNRAHPENLPVLDQILADRYALAQALGYPTFAAYAIEDKMMGTPAAAHAFLDRVSALLRAPAERELDRFLTRKRRDEPGATGLELWDVGALGEGYYDGKLRREEFGVDSKQLRDYLPYPRVRDGLFALCGELFDLTFRRVEDAELWHPTLDLVPREGKFNHAACFGVRVGISGLQPPQSALVCNFLDPATPVESVRMQYGDVVVFFHEFGHLLHALLAGHGRWLYNTMSFIEWDFVEAPSQLFEEWARDPATLARFAVNPDTGRVIPPEVLSKLAAAESLGRASGWLRQVALSGTSLAYYDRDPAGMDTTTKYFEIFNRFWPMPVHGDYHPQAGWGHLTGYSAFYYTYVWSLVIARDLLRPFLQKGTLTDRTIAQRYASEILAPGSSRPAADLIRAYLGRDLEFTAFEEWIRSASP